MNKVCNLLDNQFSAYSLEEQLHIKQLGRPMPDLNIQKTQNVSIGSSYQRTRKFNRSIYFKSNWLCGCDEKQAIFCFPCVLFGGESMWTKIGVRDLVHVWEKIRVHEKSKIHMQNAFRLSMLGKTDILSPNYKQTVTEHNEQVDKNRYVLDIIINCIRYCGAVDLVLMGQDETGACQDTGVFRDLINFSSHLDRTVKDHFTKSPAFNKGTFKAMQDELLQCMFDVYREEVTKEIKKNEYIAVIVDETTDISDEFRLVVILRYIVADKPVERFWNFVYPTGHDTVSVSDCILNEIDPLISDTPNKLIAQSYDGVSVTNGDVDGVQEIIKRKYPFANYVQYYAHEIDVIINSAASVNRSVQIFFAHLSGICSFFDTSSQRIRLLDEIVQRRVQYPLDIKWNFHSEAVNTVYEYRTDLICVMSNLQNNENIRLASTIEKAGAYMHRLNDPDFVFWLAVFHKIMPYVDIIFNQVREKNINPDKVERYLHDFEDAMQNIRLQMDEIIAYVDFELSEDEHRYHKMSRTLTLENKKMEALEMCDSIVHQIRTRFSYTGHLVMTNLFAIETFATWPKTFPENFLYEVVNTYPFLDKGRLKTELQVLYDRDELRDIFDRTVALLSLILPVEVCDIFQETLKLLRILVTMPVSTTETERCLPILKNIKNFLRNTKKEQGLDALGMLSLEKTFLNNIENFNKRVIELFASKNERKMDFQYRTV
ncbi:uncharacterized protein LOC108909230 isoform X1 [Anoplophora glabripennis]|uniref:uncharacterized protein LOC108909230 isoform X1 n=1 Tax=Anoplophora glabripennis TaxID=217634 RepID=UPI0008737872|nr:uncharacterized protein LOC108909230 isoform X1 [Anoplophora glabripennis]